MAALFETNEAHVAQRINEARRALGLRARQLFRVGGDHMQERSAIEATLQALHALELCRIGLERPMVLRTRLEEGISSIEPAYAD
jgi:hypothetical protein